MYRTHWSNQDGTFDIEVTEDEHFKGEVQEIETTVTTIRQATHVEIVDDANDVHGDGSVAERELNAVNNLDGPVLAPDSLPPLEVQTDADVDEDVQVRDDVDTSVITELPVEPEAPAPTAIPEPVESDTTTDTTTDTPADTSEPARAAVDATDVWQPPADEQPAVDPEQAAADDTPQTVPSVDQTVPPVDAGPLATDQTSVDPAPSDTLPIPSGEDAPVAGSLGTPPAGL